MLRHDELKIFAGTAHPTLARDVCQYLNIPVGESNVFKFSNDNTFVQILENVRQRDVFLIQPFAYPVNDHIMELLIMLDAARRASAGLSNRAGGTASKRRTARPSVVRLKPMAG